ncbi:hypothetical protein B5X24_HaOG208414 [Helicoverpa armigera]|uniref:Uncharacterized protein n=1 Tax=Helicoverpa armigera TaxID=29058 RepID=A0A2W1BK14_HELAM|nr:hypothetical protein B5X24_HaOG208414 [Helicoverpa armigera]
MGPKQYAQNKMSSHLARNEREFVECNTVDTLRLMVTYHRARHGTHDELTARIHERGCSAAPRLRPAPTHRYEKTSYKTDRSICSRMLTRFATDTLDFQLS